MRNYHRYTEEERAYLIGRIPKTTYVQAARDFEMRFGISRTASNMADFAKRNGIKSGYNGAAFGRLSWTDEMDRWLASSVPGRSQAEVMAAFKERFGIDLSVGQFKSRVQHLGLRHGINTGHVGCVACKIRPGWNKGMRAEDFMSADAIERSSLTRFKVGNVPSTIRPIGSEFSDERGAVFVKVNDKPYAGRFGKEGNWQPRSRIVYEREHGEVPPNCNLLHADRDPSNDDPDNLVAVDKRDYAVIMKARMQYFDRKSLEVCVALAKLIRRCYGTSKA